MRPPLKSWTPSTSAGRSSRAAEAPQALRDFVWVVRGGAWTAANTGMLYDSFRGQARSGEPKQFCDLFGLSKTTTMSVRQHSEDMAQHMVVEWCRRHQYFFDRWVEAGSSQDFEFTDEIVAGYVEPPEFSAAVRGASARTLQRVAQVRAERPQRPGR